MVVRICKSLDVLRDQINMLAPKRSKKSDGWIGDERHAAKGNKSDHNPWIRIGKDDVVSAIDVTHDPAGGLDCNVLAEAIKNDSRVKYLIFNRRILNTSDGKSWRDHDGEPHTQHMHISIRSTTAKLESIERWPIDSWDLAAPLPAKTVKVKGYAVLRPGEAASPVMEAALLQELLINFIRTQSGYSAALVELVKVFQMSRGLTVDGVVGEKTWKALQGL